MAIDPQRDLGRTRPARPLLSLRAWLRRLAGDRRGAVMAEYLGAVAVCALAMTVAYREYNHELTDAVSTRVGLLSTGNRPQVLDISGQLPPDRAGQSRGTTPPPRGAPPGTAKPGNGTGKPPAGTTKPPRGGRPPPGSRPPGDQTCTGSACTRPGQCFGAGTLVYTADGDRPIESLAVGDLVWSRSDETGELSLKPVVATFVTEDQSVFDLGVESGDTSEHLTVTSGHPFWIDRVGWVDSDEIEEGALLWSPDGALTGHAGANWGARTKVYNFEVADFHTYFVGSLHAWVHNAADCPKRKLECGDTGTYNELRKNTDANGMERDHVPSNASLAYRAVWLMFEGQPNEKQTECLSKREPNGVGRDGKPRTKPSILDRLGDSIGGIGETIAIPADVHSQYSETYGSRNNGTRIANDARDLGGAARSNLAAVRPHLSAECRAKYDQWAKETVLPLTNEEYDNRLIEKMTSSSFSSIHKDIMKSVDQCMNEGA